MTYGMWLGLLYRTVTVCAYDVVCECERLASSPRPLPVFNVARRKREGAWYLIPRDSRNDHVA